MKKKGQDVREMPLAFELVTPVVSLSSLFDPSLLPHLFFFFPHSPPTRSGFKGLGARHHVLGVIRALCWTSQRVGGDFRGSYCGLPNSTNVCVELGEVLPNETLGCCGEVLVPGPIMFIFPTAVGLTPCQVA